MIPWRRQTCGVRSALTLIVSSLSGDRPFVAAVQSWALPIPLAVYRHTSAHMTRLLGPHGTPTPR